MMVAPSKDAGLASFELVVLPYLSRTMTAFRIALLQVGQFGWRQREELASELDGVEKRESVLLDIEAVHEELIDAISYHHRAVASQKAGTSRAESGGDGVALVTRPYVGRIGMHRQAFWKLVGEMPHGKQLALDH